MPQEGAGLEHARRQMQAVTVLVQLGVLPFDQALSALSPSTAALTSCSRLARTTHHAPRPTPHTPQPTPHTPHPTSHTPRHAAWQGRKDLLCASGPGTLRKALDGNQV